MIEIKGLQGLIDTVSCVGVKPTVAILEGVASMRHGMWLITNTESGVLKEGYGLNTLTDLLVAKPEVTVGNTIKYLTLTQEQMDITLFGLTFPEGTEIPEEEEMIKMKTSLATKVGSREVTKSEVVNECLSPDVCEEHEHEPLVEIKQEEVVEETPLVPDFEHAETLTKQDLFDYATTFGVHLNKQNSKGKMLTKFKEKF